MFSFLTNWKIPFLTFALIAALSWNCVQRYQYLKLDGVNQTCQANLLGYQVAIKASQEMYQAQQSELRVRESEAAKRAAKSQKRADEIMNTEIKGGCESAIQWMIEQPH